MPRYILLISYVIILIIPTDNLQAYTEERKKYERTGDVIWEGYTNEKVVAITFDDGPNTLYTPLILDTLNKFKAKATFFVVGSQAKKHPQIIQRQFLEGHEIGNHTFSHDLSMKSLKAELDKTAKIINEITGNSPTLFRPVGGKYNRKIVDISKSQGYTLALWSWDQDTGDWRQPGVDKIVNHVITNISPGDIILFHDSGGNRRQTVEALSKILDFLKKNNYQCITVSEMIERTS